MPYDYISKSPISPFIDQFLQSKENLRPMTYKTYHTVLKFFFKLTEEEIVTEDILKNFLDEIKKRKVSERTYNNYLNIVKIYIHWLKRKNHISDSSFLEDFKGYPRPENVLSKKYYPEAMVQQFLDIKPRWLHYFLFLSFYFAFRPNELARIETADIHLDELFIEFRPSVQKVRKRDYLAIPQLFKNKFHELLTWRERQQTDASFLLVNRFGEQISRAALKYHLPKLRLIDPEFRYYHCRYTAAWRAYKNSQDIYLTQQLLRHTSPEKTVIYLGIQKDEALATQRKHLEKIFAGVVLNG